MSGDKESVIMRNEILKNIQQYQDIVDCGNPWIVEFFYNNVETDFEKLEKRLAQMEHERQINNEYGKYDDELVKDIQVMNALFEIRRTMKQLEHFEKTNDNTDGFSLV